MEVSNLPGLAMCLFFALAFPSETQDAANEQSETGRKQPTTPAEFLKSLVGSWEGTCRTWFQPGKLADESPVRGEVQPIPGGQFLRHTYESTLQGRRRTGEETIAFNSIIQKFQISWMDDFHMNDGIMFSEGEPANTGFTVTGKYYITPDEPPWGWKTVYELTDKNHLTITAYNVTPDGMEAKAVETMFTRKKP